MKCIETYLHPANAGKYSTSISELLTQITGGFVDRVYVERYKKPSWKRPHPGKILKYFHVYIEIKKKTSNFIFRIT